MFQRMEVREKTVDVAEVYKKKIESVIQILIV